jgi:N-acetylmuramoyl-L-alanine amidase
MRLPFLPPLLLLAACARTVVPVAAPAPERAGPPALPAVPAVDGPLAIRVQYPAPNQVITSRDSNFVFGSIGSGRATLSIDGHPARVYPNGAFIAFVPNPPASAPAYALVAVRGTETARLTLPIAYPASRATPAPAPAPAPPSAAKSEELATSRADKLAALASRIDSLGGALRTALARDEPIGWVQLGAPNAAADTDRVVIGRPVPGGTYKWFFLPGTVVPLVAREGSWARVRLDHALDVWVDADAARDVADSAAPDRRVAANMKVRPSATGVDVVIPTGTRPPYYVEERGDALVLTLYGVRANTDIVNYAASDTMVRTIEWTQESADRARVTVNLRAPSYGYLVVWDSASLVLKLRGRPAVDAREPLRGLTIVVDPGHPPNGATGPTGLWEPQATLAVGMRLKTLLEERGANVVMTRTTPDAVALGDRPIIARRAGAHAFVSIHLNAYPDGINPFVAPGTGTYFFRAHSEPLARAVQRGMVARMGLKDLGVNYDNLAVVRPTWYPSVLCEGAFIMLPDQEAALRTPEFQERYARGILDGLESYFRTVGAR